MAPDGLPEPCSRYAATVSKSTSRIVKRNRGLLSGSAGGGGVMNKTETKSTVLLKHHLKALKLPTMHAECEKIAQRCAADNADHLTFLLQLVELELIERERKA